jgi:beta-N-acetylhexosaminidase
MIERLGQLIITGFPDPEPSKEFLEFVSDENIGGIILFENQCNPHTKAEDIIKEISGYCSNLPFIAIDQEGGRVCRMRGAPAEFPSAGSFGESDNIESYNEIFSRAAYYIRSLGINMWLGPVADIGLNKENSCLAERTFGNTPAVVMKYVEKAVQIAREAGLLSCLKHFPGLGAAENDPHEITAQADYDVQIFLNRESLPFKAGIDAGADMVMTTHMSLPRIGRRIVTESETAINFLLRDKLNFDGVVITDDLLMKGANSLGDFEQRATKALKAGHDILLFGADFNAAREALKFLKREYKKGTLDQEKLGISLDRISGIKSKLASQVVL